MISDDKSGEKGEEYSMSSGEVRQMAIEHVPNALAKVSEEKHMPKEGLRCVSILIIAGGFQKNVNGIAKGLTKECEELTNRPVLISAIKFETLWKLQHMLPKTKGVEIFRILSTTPGLITEEHFEKLFAQAQATQEVVAETVPTSGTVPCQQNAQEVLFLQRPKD
jgi:hypothetical protein